MKGAPTRRITEVVNKCPTQAIVWKYNKDLSEAELAAQHQVQRSEENPQTLSDSDSKPAASTRVKPTNIRIMKDGPIVVEGDFKVVGGDDKELKKSIMTSFCRCGSSKSMPFCDGTHRKIAFTDE